MGHDEAAEAEDLRAAARLAADIKRRRGAAGLSQPQLARLVGYTRQYVSLAENPSRNLPSQELVRALDGALHADGALLLLRDEAKSQLRERRRVATGTSEDVSTESPVELEADLQRLRRVLDGRDLPEYGWTRPVELLDRAVAKLTDLRLHARYAQIAREVPEILTAILQTVDAGGVDRRKISRALTLAYRSADGLAFKLGHVDLSARIIELMRAAAENSDDLLLLSSVAYVRTEAFFANGDLDAAERSLVQATDRVPVKVLAKAPGAATFGSLHMRAAVVAARLGAADAAREHLSEARSMAERVPEGVYYGTAFGPASVRVHDLAVNVDLGDAPTAIERAGSWQPPSQLPAERRSQYFIETARAEVEIGRYDRAHDALRIARQIAPQHVRQHPHVRESLATLIRTRQGKDAQLTNFANWVRLSPQ